MPTTTFEFEHPNYTSSSSVLLERNDFNKPNFWSTKRILLASVGGLCVIGLVVGLAVGLTGGDDSSGGSSSPTVGPVLGSQCPLFSSTKLRKKRAVRPQERKWTRSINWTCPDSNEQICPEGFTAPPLLLVSLDGFRAEYLARNFTPTIQKIADCGVVAKYMRASFITKTFPNHYTLATGLHIESHGIIDNRFYDMEWQERFTPGAATADDGKWWGGEPIWLTSKRNGMKSASMFWPGSEANITGEYPDYCYQYDESVPYYDRVDQVLEWLQLNASERPSVITLYFEQPDTDGHSYGPLFNQMDTQLAQMDDVIDYLMDGLTGLGLEKCINVMLMADHGMDELDCTKRKIYLEDYFNTSNYYIYEGAAGRMSSQYLDNGQGIYPNPNPEPVEATMAKVECRNYTTKKDWYLRFYPKADLPKRFHYANNRRIDDIVFETENRFAVYRKYVSSGSCELGTHGYDNTYNSMNAIFMAYGPAFKQGLEIEPFDNIEVYNIMTDVLNITRASAAPNNGTYGSLHHILVTAPSVHVPATEMYAICDYPTDPTDVELRRNASDCTCDQLSVLTNLTVDEADARLNLTQSDQSEAVRRHLPLGKPQLLANSSIQACSLVQTDYITGYSDTHRMALWSGFTVTGQMVSSGSRLNLSLPDCVRADVRLTEQQQVMCSSYTNQTIGIEAAFLYHPGFSTTTEQQLDAHIQTNVVPMYTGFKQGAWRELLLLVEEYATKYSKVHLMTGPIFDWNTDGLPDSPDNITRFVNSDGKVPLPSHFYMIMYQCGDSQDCGNASAIAVILQHRPSPGNCWDHYYPRYLEENAARIRDVELLTGLVFLGDYIDERARIRLVTQLQAHLWERISWMDLNDSDATVDQAQCPHGYSNATPPVLMISVDGYRYDYITRGLSPTLERLSRLGTRATSMRPIFPSMTFPNHYSQVTGLYPESHGIIDNSMYDEDIDRSFYLGARTATDPAWWRGEPFWNTVEFNNKTSMTLFWPGSDVAIQGERPTAWLPYNGDMPYHLRVQTLLDWLVGSQGALPDFITTYFSWVDEAGHTGGPDSLQVKEALEGVDLAFRQLMDGLYKQNLHKCVNVIVVSDHGMSTISCNETVLVSEYLSEYAMNTTYTYVGTSSRISNEYVYHNGTTNEQVPVDRQVPVGAIVTNLTCADSHMNVFLKEDLPVRHHYKDSNRIDPVVNILQEQWQAERYKPWCNIIGQHGWDPANSNLWAFFSAFGPAFHNGLEVEPFENIELVNMLAALVNVSAPPNNGTLGSLHHVLKQAPSLPDSEGDTYTNCPYPVSEEEYKQVANLSYGCVCQGLDVETLDERLNISTVESLESLHLAHGHPAIMNNDSLCTLYHEDYISGYDQLIGTVKWTASTLTSQPTSVVIPDCLRPDVRLTPYLGLSCDDYAILNDTDGLQQAFMFPTEWSSSNTSVADTLLLSNAVPMLKSFRDGVWASLLTHISGWIEANSSLHVLLGPIYATNWMSSFDTPVPSHFFAIVLRCDKTDCGDMDYTPINFILPHQANITNCMTYQRYLSDNMVRIRDVELLTGLQFLTKNNTFKAVQRRTYMPTQLWT